MDVYLNECVFVCIYIMYVYVCVYSVYAFLHTYM